MTIATIRILFFAVSGDEEEEDKISVLKKIVIILKENNRDVSSLELHWYKPYGTGSQLMAKCGPCCAQSECRTRLP